MGARKLKYCYRCGEQLKPSLFLVPFCAPCDHIENKRERENDYDAAHGCAPTKSVSHAR